MNAKYYYVDIVPTEKSYNFRLCAVSEAGEVMEAMAFTLVKVFKMAGADVMNYYDACNYLRDHARELMEDTNEHLE